MTGPQLGELALLRATPNLAATQDDRRDMIDMMKIEGLKD
jgi:hypothetical protein